MQWERDSQPKPGESKIYLELTGQSLDSPLIFTHSDGDDGGRRIGVNFHGCFQVYNNDNNNHEMTLVPIKITMRMMMINVMILMGRMVMMKE